MAPAIESWFDFGRKSSTGNSDGTSKFDAIAGHFDEIVSVFKGLQANFLFGVDADHGAEPALLTRAFIRRFPSVFPGIAYPIAFGGVPLRETLRQDGRLLPLPPMYYFDPVPTLILKNYGVLELLDQLISIFQEAANPTIFLRRVLAPGSSVIRLMHGMRTLELASYIRELRRLRNAVLQQAGVQSFCEGRLATVPPYYDHLLDQRLGRFAEIIPRKERYHLAE